MITSAQPRLERTFLNFFCGNLPTLTICANNTEGPNCLQIFETSLAVRQILFVSFPCANFGQMLRIVARAAAGAMEQ